MSAALVLGASGLIGSAVAARLVRDGWAVTATVRTQGAAQRAAEALAGSTIEALPDIRNEEGVARLLRSVRPRLVILATATNPGPGNGARGYAEGNVTVPAVVLEACRVARVERVVLFGSGFEYAPSEQPLDEAARPGPTTLYGATKAAGSAIARFMREAGLEVCVVRPFSVYGPRERLHRFVPAAIVSGLAGEPIEISDGTQVRDYLHADDVALAVALLASRTSAMPAALNLAGAQRHTLIDLAQLVAGLTGRGSSVHAGVRRANEGDRAVFLGDARLARQALGWAPDVSLEAGIARTVDWYAAHRSATAQGRAAA